MPGNHEGAQRAEGSRSEPARAHVAARRAAARCRCARPYGRICASSRPATRPTPRLVACPPFVRTPRQPFRARQPRRSKTPSAEPPALESPTQPVYEHVFDGEHPLRRAPRAHGVQLPRRGVGARGDGRRGGGDGARGARDHRPRRPVRLAGLRARGAGGGRAAHHRRRAHPARRVAPHPAGRRRDRLRQPLPAHHHRPRGHPPPSGPPAAARRPSTASALAAHAQGLVCLTGCARHGLVPRLVAAGERRAAEETLRELVRDFGPGNVQVEIQRPRTRGDRRLARDLVHLAEAVGVPCVATGDPHAHTPRAGPAAGRLRGHRPPPDPGRLRGGAPRQPPRRAAAARGDGRPVRRPPRGGRPDPAHGRAPGVRPHPRPGLPLPRLRGVAPGRDRPGRAGARVRPPARRALPQRPQARAGARAAGRGAGPDRPPRPGRLLPAAPRHPGAGARGGAAGAPGRIGAALAAARARARLVGRLDRLLPDRALAHRPGRERPLPGALPQPRHGVGARHRPRLPARRPRAAHRGDHRPLRPRARGPGGGLPHLPHPHGDPPAGRGPGAARGRPGAAGAPRRRLVVGRRGGGGAGAPARRRGQAGLAALAGAGVPGARGGGAAPTPVTALGRHGGERPPADRAGAGGAGRLPRAPDLPVGQGLLRRRRLREDRPARPGDALVRRGVHRPDRPRARRERRPLAHRLHRPGGLRRDPGRRHRRACSRSRAAPRCRACCRRGPRTWTTSPSRWPSSAPGR